MADRDIHSTNAHTTDTHRSITLSKSKMATSMPPTVAKFFCGKPRDQEYMDNLTNDIAEDFELSFVGEFVPPFMKNMKMTYETLPKGIGNLWNCFPDLTFSPQEEPKLQADGGWKASTKVTGKHTGPAFSPAPHLDPVPTSNKVSFFFFFFFWAIF